MHPEPPRAALVKANLFRPLDSVVRAHLAVVLSVPFWGSDWAGTTLSGPSRSAGTPARWMAGLGLRSMSDTDLVYDSASRHSPFGQALVDLYGYRGLVRLVVQRDLTVRYKRSLLGVSWTVLNPVLTSLVMWAVFNAIFHPKIPGHVPYIVYLLSG